MHPNGWRVFLGLAGVPAFVLFIGSIVITETPTSLIECGNETARKSTLRKIRGVDHVNAEFEQFKAASEIARQVRHPYKKTMKCSSMPTLVIGIQLQIFHQLTGIDAVMFYALGFKNDPSLLSAVITGIVKTAVGAISLALMTTSTLTKVQAAIVVVHVCSFVMSFAWSWGPLGWLIPSETFPLETRTAGFASAETKNNVPIDPMVERV
ncbi:hypothetical protein H0E87_015576 [Populus deltoides]|uniref:Major facilitator superfamily (MFS) profile domain-containing protein n=1 Tax=Populus deltoides TaxID=3696 RepID=A0A8T2Y5K3_POPDE|nr:hypothetical protein H0E87_015576 [Populus deltoides]